MNYKKTAAHCGLELLEAEIENFMNTLNLSEIIRMDFLEQSAKYLGVFVESNPTDLADDKLIN